MKKRKCWRYTCEFCKKTGGRADAIAVHEARCFCNPNRKCTMCGDEQEPIGTLTALFEGATQDDISSFVEAVEVAAHGCPACTVAAIRQSTHLITERDFQKCSGEIIQIPDRIWAEYDYKAKAREYLQSKREEEASYIQL